MSAKDIDQSKYDRIAIEPERGQTYSRETFAVYGYRPHSDSSVLAGQMMRQYLDGGFTTVEEAQRVYPFAEVARNAHFVAPNLSGLSDEESMDPLGDNRAIAEEMAQEELVDKYEAAIARYEEAGTPLRLYTFGGHPEDHHIIAISEAAAKACLRETTNGAQVGALLDDCVATVGMLRKYVDGFCGNLDDELGHIDRYHESTRERTAR